MKTDSMHPWSLLENSHILVIGGAGFVGGNLCHDLLEKVSGVRVTIVDNLLSAEKENIPTDSRVRFIEGSIATDSTLGRIADEYDYVFHLATFHGNQNSIQDPIADHENNAFGTLKLFEHLKGFKRIKKVVYSGAGCAVAEKTDDSAIATKESAAVSLQMDSPYSISKILGEFYSIYYWNHSKLPIVRARFQNVYGPREILGAGQWRGTLATVWRNVTPVFVYKSLKKQSLPLEGEGKTSRDFIFVEDIARGLAACAVHGAAGDVYNLASGVETTILELAQTINALTGNPTSCEMLPRRNWDHSGKRFGCPEKSKREIHFSVMTSLQDGLRKTIAWTRDNMELIEKNILKHSQQMTLSKRSA